MNNIVISDIFGYIAAVFTNISIYPQAYKVYTLVKDKKYQELKTISLITISLHIFGCMLWIIYAVLDDIKIPLLMGCIMAIIPNSYILIQINIINYFYKNENLKTESK